MWRGQTEVYTGDQSTEVKRMSPTFDEVQLTDSDEAEHEAHERRAFSILIGVSNHS